MGGSSGKEVSRAVPRAAPKPSTSRILADLHDCEDSSSNSSSGGERHAAPRPRGRGPSRVQERAQRLSQEADVGQNPDSASKEFQSKPPANSETSASQGGWFGFFKWRLWFRSSPRPRHKAAPPPGKRPAGNNYRGRLYVKQPSKGPKSRPGRPPPGKAPPFKAPPGKAPPFAKAALKSHASSSNTNALPIGRRLSVKAVRILDPDSEAFRGILTPAASRAGSRAPSCCGSDAGSDSGKETDWANPYGDDDRLVRSVSDSACWGAATPRRGRQRSLGLDPSAVDLDALRNAFGPQAKPIQPPPRRQISKNSQVELLQRGLAQNFGIAFKKLRVDTERIATGLQHLDPELCSLSTDDTSLLMDVWPVDDALEPLAKYMKEGRDVSQLRDVERQLLPFVAVPRLRPRLRIVALAGSLEERVCEATIQISKVQLACSEIQSSGLFRDILAIILILFNYVNFGTEKVDEVTSLRGVDVQSLLRLRETKAYKGDFPNFNMLHFVIKQLLQQNPDAVVQHLDEELANVLAAARISLDQLRKDLVTLREDHAFVQTELKDHGSSYMEAGEEEAGHVEPQQPLAETSGKSLVERLLAKGLDFASFAEAWARGDEVVGMAYHPCENTPGFDAVIGVPSLARVGSPSGKMVSTSSATTPGPPPPGWLWIYQLSGRWQRCWCEVRTSILVVYKIKEQQCVGTSYMVLPGAQVCRLEADGASEVARRLSAMAPNSFEIKNSSSSQVARLCAGSAMEAKKWLEVIKEQADLTSVGFLVAHKSGWPSLGSIRKNRYYCVLHHGVLSGYARPRDGIEGTPPVYVWNLDTSSVRALRSPNASTDARKLAVGTPFGFEINVLDNGTEQTWQFACDSHAEERAWLREFAQEAQSSEPLDGVELQLSPRDHHGKAHVDTSELLRSFAAPSGQDAQKAPSEMQEKAAEAVGQSGSGTDAAATEGSGRDKALDILRVQLALQHNAEHQHEQGELPLAGLAPKLSTANLPWSPGSPIPRGPWTAGTPPTDVGTSLSCCSDDDDLDDPASDRGSPFGAGSTTASRRLELLGVRLGNGVSQWERALAAADVDCRGLLAFFGQEAPSGPKLGVAANQLLEAVAEFSRQLRVAWNEVDAAAKRSEELRKKKDFRQQVAEKRSSSVGTRVTRTRSASRGRAASSTRSAAADHSLTLEPKRSSELLAGMERDQKFDAGRLPRNSPRAVADRRGLSPMPASRSQDLAGQRLNMGSANGRQAAGLHGHGEVGFNRRRSWTYGESPESGPSHSDTEVGSPKGSRRSYGLQPAGAFGC